MTESTTDLAQLMQQLQGSSSTHPLPETSNGLLPNGKKTKGRVKIKMEYIGNKLRRYTTFSKRKTGIMKKAYELSTLTGTQVMLLVASETGHVYTYATKKLQPMIASEAGKTLIQTCLNSPGEGTDLQPSKTEFTFETGSSTVNPRKRKINDGSDAGTNALASFLPTMVPTALFSNFNEEDYNQADSGDDTDSEEPSESKEEVRDTEDLVKKDSEPAAVTSTALNTIKEALREAASNRQQLKKARSTPNIPPPKPPQTASNAFLAPFLLSGLTSSQTNQSTVFQLPQGCMYTNNPGSPEGGANAGGLFLGGAKTADDAATPANPLLSFPFQFNLQQLIESAALSAQMTNTD